MEITHEEGELPSTFVDGRNLLFLSFAAVFAKQVGASHIVTGVCETDFSGYPDCSDMFREIIKCYIKFIYGLSVCYSYTTYVD